MKKIIKFFYRYFPKSLIRLIGGSKLLEGVRKKLLRPDGTLEILREKITFDGQSFIFQAPLRTLVKAGNTGIEPRLIRNSKKLINDLKRKNLVVFDIGCNYGFVSLALRTGVSNIQEVVAFEPHPKLYGILQETFSLNGFTDIAVENAAVGAEEGKVTINLYEGTANVIDIHEKLRGTCEVELITIDGFVEKTGKKPDYIKIDVDGYELDVLRGMIGTLRDCRPILVVETNGSVELLNFVKEQGYTCFDEQLHPVGSEVPENAYCIPA